MNRVYMQIRSILLLSLLFFASCGGGTSGSGLKRYEGRIATADNQALSEISVTIENTGDSSVTNSGGEFVIDSQAAGPDVNFLLESPDFISRFVLKDIPEDSSHVTMHVLVDPESQVAEVQKISVRAWMTGECDGYFQNGDFLHQADVVPNDLQCSLHVRVFGDGKPLTKVPVALQYSNCANDAHWRTLRVARTGNGEEPGSTDISFHFVDSEQFCRYRVIAAFNSTGTVGAVYRIDTLTEQHQSR